MWRPFFGTGSLKTSQPVIFTYFASSLSWNFCKHSSFNLTRNACPFYWCYTFSYENSWTVLLKISMQIEKAHVAIDEHNKKKDGKMEN